MSATRKAALDAKPARKPSVKKPAAKAKPEAVYDEKRARLTEQIKTLRSDSEALLVSSRNLLSRILAEFG